jgi:hypothetical protein
MVGPWEVLELEVQKFETSMTGLLGVLVAGPATATTEVEDVTGGPP